MLTSDHSWFVIDRMSAAVALQGRRGRAGRVARRGTGRVAPRTNRGPHSSRNCPRGSLNGKPSISLRYPSTCDLFLFVGWRADKDPVKKLMFFFLYWRSVHSERRLVIKLNMEIEKKKLTVPHVKLRNWQLSIITNMSSYYLLWTRWFLFLVHKKNTLCLIEYN